MAKTKTYTMSSDGSSSSSVTSSNRLGSRTTTVSTRRTRSGFVSSKSVTQTQNSGSVFILLKIVLVMMLTLSLFSLLFGHQTFFGFQTLLNTLSEVPAGDLTSVIDVVQIPSIDSNWGLIDGVRTFLNTFINLINSTLAFGCYIGYGFVQLLSLLGYFIGLL